VAASFKLIWRSLGLSLLLALPGACGGGSLSGAQAPERDELTSDLEQKASELEAELAKLETKSKKEPEAGGEDLETQTDAGQAETKVEPGAESTSASPPAPPPAEPAPAEEARDSSVRDRCKTACRALGSMERSAERICALVGQEHEKCAWARTQVKDARGRVEQAGCSCQK
jgi:hypothetical protein